jgi:hypothetical protein
MRLPRIGPNIKDEPFAKQRELLGVVRLQPLLKRFSRTPDPGSIFIETSLEYSRTHSALLNLVPDCGQLNLMYSFILLLSFVS